MKKLLLSLFITALALWAADFWQTKPFANWDQKEILKVLTDSPWAKKVTVSMPGAGGLGNSGGSGGGGGGGRGRSGPQGPTTDPGIAGGGGGGIAETSGGGRGGGGFGAGGGGGGDAIASVNPSIQLLVSFQSALPVREAGVKSKYGAEATTSPEAKAVLDREEKSYVIAVSGLPSYIQPRDDQAKQLLLKQTTLTAKGKEPLEPNDVQFQADGRNIDAIFLFPRTSPFGADDKEVEFATKAGPIGVKTKFNLKNMVFNGKLEM